MKSKETNNNQANKPTNSNQTNEQNRLAFFDELVYLLPDPSALRFLRDFLQDFLPGILPAFCQLGTYLQTLVLSGSQLSQV